MVPFLVKSIPNTQTNDYIISVQSGKDIKLKKENIISAAKT